MKASITRILVPLDPSDYAQAATETACRLARDHNAQIAGVAVLDSPGIQSDLMPAIGPYYPMMGDQFREKIAHASEVIDDCKKRFAETCEEHRVPHFETEYEGIPATKLLESSIFSDLIVMGLRTHFHFETREGSDGNSLDLFLDRTITPVLAVPKSGLGEIRKAVVAFDGSIGSARALHDFTALVQPYDPEVTLVVAEKSEEESTFLLNHATEFLRSHSINQVETVASDDPIETVMDAQEADLFVAGIHSKKPIKDFFVGSLAKHLIKKGDTALFLSH